VEAFSRQPMEHSLDLPLAHVLQTMQDRLMGKSSYHGIQTLKNPIDFWVYQELVYEIRPDLIIEIGVHHGGSSLAFAHMLDHNGKGRIIGLDSTLANVDEKATLHERIEFMEGDAKELVGEIRAQTAGTQKVLVIEDSSHEYENTLQLLRLYGDLVTVGSYFIVEDSICHHGLDVGPEPGPYEAINTFIQENDSFEIDRSREDFLITWNPCGYLKKIR
jgi:cephalosporin hydroxylase